METEFTGEFPYILNFWNKWSLAPTSQVRGGLGSEYKHRQDYPRVAP